MEAGVRHPEHETEQRYIERAHEAFEATRRRASEAAGSGADKFARRSIRKQMTQRLSVPVEPNKLVFGRIDREDGRTHYIGRSMIHGPGSQLLVANWAAPAARPFYTATSADRQGLALRRRFLLDDLRLLGITDEQFVRSPQREPVAEPTPPTPEEPTDPEPSTGVVPDDVTQVLGEPPSSDAIDSILADMERARGSEMRDIVATIARQQYDLISAPLDGLRIIQGGPGTGKTAVALHRAAWLLFNHRDELARPGVLVVGPNRAFMEYVGNVLPGLGEASVVQVAVDRLPDLADVRVRGVDPPAAAAIKGDLRMASVIQRAVAARVRPPAEDLSVRVRASRVSLPADDVRGLVGRAQEDAPTHLAGRVRFRETLTQLLAERVRERGGFLRSASQDELARVVAADGGPLDRVWPTLTAPEVVRDLLNSRRRLREAASELTDGERAALHRSEAPSLREEPWTTADIALLDEADAALRGVQSTYGYVLADEAQDLSPMQVRMVMRRSTGGRATLVGDIAQATGALRFHDWSRLLEAAGIEQRASVSELRLGYRVPRQIMELAGQLLPRVAPTLSVPRAVRSEDDALRVAECGEEELPSQLVEEVRRHLAGERKIAVIAPARRLAAVRGLLDQAGIETGEVLSDGLSRKVTVLAAAQAKGLEFDHVAVLEPTAIAGPEGDWALVYIALTRATKTLAVLHTTPEPFTPDEGETRPAPADDLPAIDSTGEDIADRREAMPLLAPQAGGTILGARYAAALGHAHLVHGHERRRGSLVPAMAHLQAVAAIVLDDGGTEDEAIAALLHDTVEREGDGHLERLAALFGVDVARIVAGCRDPLDSPEVTWTERKTAYLEGLEYAGPSVRRVALAEALDNARAWLRGFNRQGPTLWTQVNVDPEEVLWYLSALADLFVTERPGDLASELQETVDRLLDVVSRPEPVG